MEKIIVEEAFEGYCTVVLMTLLTALNASAEVIGPAYHTTPQQTKERISMQKETQDISGTLGVVFGVQADQAA